MTDRLPSRARSFCAVAGRQKKPTWPNTLRYSATSVYSSTGSPAGRAALYLVIRRCLLERTIFSCPADKQSLSHRAATTQSARGALFQPFEHRRTCSPNVRKELRRCLTDESPAGQFDRHPVALAARFEPKVVGEGCGSFPVRLPGFRQRES